MELAQIGHDGAAQQVEAVVAAVAVDIGMEIARGRRSLLATASADQPSGPSVAICTTSGRCIVHSRVRAAFYGRPTLRAS